MIFRRSACFQLTALALIISATFFNSLHSSFKMDDHDFFKDPKIINPKLLGYNWIPEPDRALGLSRACEESGFRPVTNTFLALAYQAFGRHVQAYHALMIALFFMGCAMIYWFVLLLSADALLAFLTAVLFAVHPVNGLAVNYVVAAAYAYQLIFAMLCMICFLRSYESKIGEAVLILSFVFFLMSLGVHETSIILPFYLFLIAWYRKPGAFIQSLFKVSPFFFLLGGYLYFRMFHASLKTGVIEKLADFQMSVIEYAASFAKLVLWYLSQLILPDGVVLMWSTKVVRVDCWAWCLLGGVVFAASMWFIKRAGRCVASFALMMFLTGFGPVLAACLFRPATGLIMEPHWMFLPVVGYFLLFAHVLTQLIRRNLWTGIVLCAGLVMGFIKISHSYNDIWRDDKSYGYYWLEKAPEFKTTHFFIAYSLIKDRNYAEARRFLREAREGVFSDWQIYTNLGLMDYQEGNDQGAIENYRMALTCNPSSPEIYNNLALVYERSGDIEKALRANQKALALNRFLVEPRLNLARIAIASKDVPAALELYRANLKLFPCEARTLQLYFRALVDAGEFDMLQVFVGDLLRDCRDAAALTDVAKVAAQKKLYVIALDIYMQVLRVDPNYAPVYVHAGVLLANLNQLERAIGLWEQALELNPADAEASRLIIQAEEIHHSQNGSLIQGPNSNQGEER